MWRTHLAIREAARQDRSTAVVFSGEGIRWIVLVVLACRFARVPIVHTRGEFPFVYERTVGWPRRIWQRWYVDNVFKSFDGMVVITTYLEDYMRPRMRPGAWLMRIPILVDVNDYQSATEATPGLVGYAATLDRPEEIEALVRSIACVARSHPEARARLMGPGSPEDLAYLSAAADAAGARDLVDAVGQVDAADVPAALCSCAALALPRADDVFSRAGMPTKLGEYLATGRPVVVTATGDIPRYLVDGVSAFLVPPGNAEAFNVALEHALFDPAAAAIGQAGRQVARSQFDAATQMRRLLGAIERRL
jgi:glycosyltransferase involved in cell wall biosynthesis